jgi:hypothetical protein
MAYSWGAGNTDTKFYEGSSSSNAWTRDLLWKRSIADEAKLMGFLPKAAEPENNNNDHNRGKVEGGGTFVTQLPATSPRRLPPMDTSLPLPSARSSSMKHHMQKMKQKMKTQEMRQKAILARAQEMFQDRKRFGGTLNRKEAKSWSSFMSNLKAPNKHISARTGEIDPHAANVSHTRFDARPRTSGASTGRRTRLAQTRSFVAQKNRRAANRVAIINEQKRLRLGGREPPFLTDSAALSQLGGRPSSMASGLYGKPVEELMPRYGSVTDLPVYDEPHLWEEEGELNVGEVFAPLPGEEDNKDMYKTAYRLSFPRSNEEEVEVGVGMGVGANRTEGGERRGEDDEEREEAQQKGGEHYVLIAEEETEDAKRQINTARSDIPVNADKIIGLLELENQARLTARRYKRRAQTRGSSRRSTLQPTGLTGRPGTTPTC